MIASLPMYWRAENAGLWRAFWQRVQDQTSDLPDLTPPEDLPADWTAHWRDPNLILSMTCGLPFRTILRDKVCYVGTLAFDLDVPDGHYYSVRISRRDDNAAPRRLAYNAPDSQSGWAAAAGSYDSYLQTGSHAASLAAVADGAADCAYLDAVTWRLLQRFDPAANAVQVDQQTVPTPALPLITAKGRDAAPLRAAITAALEQFTCDDPAAMGGRLHFAQLSPATYFAVPVPAPPP